MGPRSVFILAHHVPCHAALLVASGLHKPSSFCFLLLVSLHAAECACSRMCLVWLGDLFVHTLVRMIAHPVTCAACHQLLCVHACELYTYVLTHDVVMQVDDQGLVNTDPRTIAVPNAFINNIPTDIRGLTFSRTPQQLINMYCLGDASGISPFFPNGFVGAINSPAGYTNMATGLEDFPTSPMLDTQVRAPSMPVNSSRNCCRQVVLMLTMCCGSLAIVAAGFSHTC